MDDLITYKEVARIINAPVGTVYALVSQGRIPYIRIGGRFIRFRPADIQAWIASHQVDVAADADTRKVRQ